MVLNKILFYGGIVLAILFFILSIVVFFTQGIPTVIRYYLRKNNKKVIKFPQNKGDDVYKNLSKEFKSKEIDKLEETELLSVAQNYATALLEADNSTYILDLDDEDVLDQS